MQTSEVKIISVGKKKGKSLCLFHEYKAESKLRKYPRRHILAFCSANYSDIPTTQYPSWRRSLRPKNIHIHGFFRNFSTNG